MENTKHQALRRLVNYMLDTQERTQLENRHYLLERIQRPGVVRRTRL